MIKDDLDDILLDLLFKQQYYHAVVFVRDNAVGDISILTAKRYVDDLMESVGITKDSEYRIFGAD
jgi:hypothetical protein